MDQWVSVKMAYTNFVPWEVGWVWETQGKDSGEGRFVEHPIPLSLTPPLTPQPPSPKERGRKRRIEGQTTNMRWGTIVFL